MKTFGEVAQEMLDNLVTRKRDDGSEYICQKNQVEWQTEIYHAAHGDRLPDDDVYSRIYDILCSFSECETEEDAQDRVCEIEPDCYTADLTAWLASNINNVFYMGEAISNGATNGFDVLAWAQKAYIDEIAHSLLSGISSHMEEEENA